MATSKIPNRGENLSPGCAVFYGDHPDVQVSGQHLITSYERVRRDAPSHQRRSLDSTFIEIMFSPGIWNDEGVDTLTLDSLRHLSVNFASDSTINSVTGRSAADLFVLRDSAYLEYLRYATDRMDSLRKKARQDSITLSQIQVLDADFRQRRIPGAGIVSDASVRVRNNLDTAVLGFDFDAVLKDPERTIPYAESEVVVNTVPGGIEPGEARWMDLTFTDPVWSRDIFPDGAELTISPTNIYLEDFDSYLNSQAGAAEFDVQDSLRLDSLRHVLDTFTPPSGNGR